MTLWRPTRPRPPPGEAHRFSGLPAARRSAWSAPTELTAIAIEGWQCLGTGYNCTSRLLESAARIAVLKLT